MSSLKGIKVVEVATFIAGPYCAMTLADHGADVIKVERPGTGDENRTEPPFVGDESAPFMLWNRNKRSVILDLKTPDGKAAFRNIVKDADVLIENLRPGAMDRLGLGYEALSQDNPGLIYAAVSGYGRSGPLHHKGGFDLVMQGFSGLMALNGPEDGPPFRISIPICDILAGSQLVSGILLALHARHQNGKGQKVEASLFEAALSLQLYEIAGYLATGESPARLGQRHRGVAPYQVMSAADGYLTVGVGHQNLWERFCDVLGRPDWTSWPQFADNSLRVKNAAELARKIEEVFATEPVSHWLDKLDKAGIPCGRIQTIDEALEHPQTTAREMVLHVDHHTLGSQATLGIPVKLSATPGSIRLPAPVLGQHTDEILSSYMPETSS